jgi:integrase/recombinase XerD
MSWEAFRPAHALEVAGGAASNAGPSACSAPGAERGDDGRGPAGDPAGSGDRQPGVLAAVSSFYEYAVMSGQLGHENPLERRADHASERVSDRQRPFMDGASRQRPVRRTVRVKTVQAVPRPLDDAQVTALLGALRCRRDRALILLMLDGGLRPGEALGVCLDDIALAARVLAVALTPHRRPGSALRPASARSL